MFANIGVAGIVSLLTDQPYLGRSWNPMCIWGRIYSFFLNRVFVFYMSFNEYWGYRMDTPKQSQKN
jgi:hypothetical protein